MTRLFLNSMKTLFFFDLRSTLEVLVAVAAGVAVVDESEEVEDDDDSLGGGRTVKCS